MSELARGSLRDRPWGMTLGALGLRRLTGQITIKSEGKQYCVAFEQGAVVGATSPLPVDAVGRIALTSQFATAAQVSAIQRKTAAFPDRDEIELVAEMNSLTPDQAFKLRRRVVAQRAARTFALEVGDFVVSEQTKIATHLDGALDIRAVVFYGARVNLSEDRLIADLRPFGQQFILVKTALADLEQYGFTEVEAPVLELLHEGANLPELEATCRDIDPRTLRAIIYALISCNGAEPQTNVPPRRIVTPVPVAPVPVPPPGEPVPFVAGRPTRTDAVAPASRAQSDVIAPPIADPHAGPLDVSITIGNRTVRPSSGGLTPSDLYAQSEVAMPRTTTGVPKPTMSRTTSRSGMARSTKPPAAANDPASLNTPSALRAAAPTTSPPRGRAHPPTPPTPPQTTAIGTDPGSRPTIPATGTPTPSTGITFARAATPLPSEMPMFPADAPPPSEPRAPTPPFPSRATTPPQLGRATTPPQLGRATTPSSPAFGRTQTPLPLPPIDLGLGPNDSGVRRLSNPTQPPLSRTSTDPALLAAAAAESSPHLPRTSTDNAALAEEAFTRGKSALRREEIPEAIAELTAAVQLNGNDVDYQAMLAWAKFCHANDKTAIAEETRKWLGRAVLKSPKPEVARFYLGRVERMLGRHREALRHFQEVLAVTPRHAEAQAEVRMLENTLQNEGRGGLFKRK